MVVQGVEHIGILYARQSLVEARAWLNAAFGRSGEGLLDARGGAIGLLLGGLLALAWPLSHLLPRAAAAPAGGGLPWRRFWPIALLPAIATPLLLRLLPTSFLPILLGDYLTVHCAVYGVLTAAGLWWARRREAPAARAASLAVILAALAIAAYAILGLGLALDRFVLSFLPAPHRAWLVPALLLGTLPWFLADEWATRGPGAARLAYPATKRCSCSRCSAPWRWTAAAVLPDHHRAGDAGVSGGLRAVRALGMARHGVAGAGGPGQCAGVGLGHGGDISDRAG